MIVITDGEKYLDPLEYSDVIPEADRKGIIRYVIGVGNVALRLDTCVGFYSNTPSFELASINNVKMGPGSSLLAQMHLSSELLLQ